MSSLNDRRRALLAQRVSESAMALDARLPGWENEIDIDMLDIANGDYCLIGQIWGPYNETVAHLGGQFANPIRAGVVVPANFDSDRARADYRELTILWKIEIDNRRRAASPEKIAA